MCASSSGWRRRSLVVVRRRVAGIALRGGGTCEGTPLTKKEARRGPGVPDGGFGRNGGGGERGVAGEGSALERPARARMGASGQIRGRAPARAPISPH